MSMTTNDELFLEKYSAVEAFNDPLTMEHFETMEKIGEGAFAIVYKVRLIQDTTAKIPDIAAIKRIENRKLTSSNRSEMASNEVKMFASLTSVFVLEYYTSFTTIDYSCIVLEWMSFDLFKILRTRKYFGETTARFISSQVLLALEHLHSFRVAYRDLKPENILMDDNRNIKITDLSFCKHIPGRSYTCQGTVEYMAPELILSEGHGLGVDWWAFGILIYELCAGYTPFRTSTTLNLMKNIIRARVKFPLQFSDEIKDLIKRLVVPDVTQRLGCLKLKSGDIKLHSWFLGDVDWKDLQRQYFRVPKELSDLSDIKNCAV